MPDGAAGLWRVLRKELLEGVRERRALLSALVFGPLFGPALFVGVIGFTMNLQVDESMAPIEVPAVGARDATRLTAHLRAALIDLDHDRFADAEALRAAVRAGDAPSGLVVDEGFALALANGAPARVWVVEDSANNATQVARSRLRAALQDYGGLVGANRLQLRGVDPGVIRPLAVLSDDVATPASRAILIFGMMTYFLIFATLLGGMQVAIDTTAGERERGTLEPLLTLPVNRAALVIGKSAATLAFMVLALGIAVASFGVAAKFLPLAKVGMAANLGPGASLGVYLAMAPFAVLGAGMMMAVASYTKSFREAQTFTSLAMVAPALPIIVVFLNPMQPSLPWMLVPSLSQHLLVTAIVKGHGVEWTHAAVSAATTTTLGLLCVWATVARYRSERLLV